MSSFDSINYSLSPNKTIQRHIVFDALEMLDRHVGICSGIYIGFGSIWFSDFLLAHKRLGVNRLISIENNPVGAVRARFNAPFRAIEVEEGDSTPVLRDLVRREDMLNQPWIVWLDYDRSVSQTTTDDIELIVTHAPQNSVLILTLDAGGLNMSGTARAEYLRNTLGDAISDQLENSDFEVEKMPEIIGDGILNFLCGRAVDLGRPGGFVPAFKIPYKDSAQMITCGGILPAQAARGAARACIADKGWPGFPNVAVKAPPLTLKEVLALQRLMPSHEIISRGDVQGIGFDLLEDQIEAYSAHYRRYPTFSQVIS